MTRNKRDLVPVEGVEGVMADPTTAAIIEGRIERGEITPEEVQAILDYEPPNPVHPMNRP